MESVTCLLKPLCAGGGIESGMIKVVSMRILVKLGLPMEQVSRRMSPEWEMMEEVIILWGSLLLLVLVAMNVTRKEKE